MPATISRRDYAAMYGPTTGDRVRLADTEPHIRRHAGDRGVGRPSHRCGVELCSTPVICIQRKIGWRSRAAELSALLIRPGPECFTSGHPHRAETVDRRHRPDTHPISRDRARRAQTATHLTRHRAIPRASRAQFE